MVQRPRVWLGVAFYGFLPPQMIDAFLSFPTSCSSPSCVISPLLNPCGRLCHQRSLQTRVLMASEQCVCVCVREFGGVVFFLSAIITCHSQSELCQLPWRPSLPPPRPVMPTESHTGEFPRQSGSRDAVCPHAHGESVLFLAPPPLSAPPSFFFSGGSIQLV